MHRTIFRCILIPFTRLFIFSLLGVFFPTTNENKTANYEGIKVRLRIFFRKHSNAIRSALVKRSNYWEVNGQSSLLFLFVFLFLSHFPTPQPTWIDFDKYLIKFTPFFLFSSSFKLYFAVFVKSHWRCFRIVHYTTWMEGPLCNDF